MRSVVVLAWAAAFCGILASGPVTAQTRGLTVVEKTSGRAVALYEESHALVIGVADYTNGWPRLRGVRDDIPAIKAALEKQGFQVDVVMDPDRDGLDRAFRTFIARYGQRLDSRLLFYYAGHGHTVKLAYGGQMGYLVPREAPNPNVDAGGFLNSALAMQTVETYARTIQSKHALFIFDACFAGAIFDATRAIPEAIAEKTGRPVRQFITSGTAEQQVPDTSIFRREFVAALDGEGDLDRDGYVTGAELGQFLETKVTNYSRRSQTPQYGKLRDPLLDKGDFVFALPAAPAASAAPMPATQPTAEVVFWQSVQNSTSGGDYCAYLEAFPKGMFAPLAQARARQYGGACLSGAQVSTAAQPAAPRELRFAYDVKGGRYVRRMSGTVVDVPGLRNALAPLQPPPGAHGAYGLIGDDPLLGKESGYGLRRLGAVARRYLRIDSLYVEQPPGFASIGVQSGTFTNVGDLNDTTLGWVLFDLRDKLEADLKKFVN